MLYTVSEVAKLFKVNKAYVYKLIDSGLLTAIKLGSLKITQESLDKFIKEYNGYNVNEMIGESKNDTD